MNVGGVGSAGAAGASPAAAGAVSPGQSGGSGNSSPVHQGSEITQGSTEKSSGGDLNDNSISQTINNNTTIFSNTNMSTSDILSLRSSTGTQGCNGLSSTQSVNPMGESQDMQKMMEKLIEMIIMMMIMKMMEQMMSAES